jgi:hypothetical protein
MPSRQSRPQLTMVAPRSGDSAGDYWDLPYLDCVDEKRSDRRANTKLQAEEHDYRNGIGRL